METTIKSSSATVEQTKKVLSRNSTEQLTKKLQAGNLIGLSRTIALEILDARGVDTKSILKGEQGDSWVREDFKSKGKVVEKKEKAHTTSVTQKKKVEPKPDLKKVIKAKIAAKPLKESGVTKSSQIELAYQEGLTVAEISAKLNAHPSFVRGVIGRLKERTTK